MLHTGNTGVPLSNSKTYFFASGRFGGNGIAGHSSDGVVEIVLLELVNPHRIQSPLDDWFVLLGEVLVGQFRRKYDYTVARRSRHGKRNI